MEQRDGRIEGGKGGTEGTGVGCRTSDVRERRDRGRGSEVLCQSREGGATWC